MAVTTPPAPRASATARSASTAIFAVAFVVLGLPDFAHGVAWPDMRADFDRPLAALGTFLVVAAGGYLLVAVSTGRLAGRWGLEGLVLRSTLSSAVGLLIIAVAPTWPVVLVRQPPLRRRQREGWTPGSTRRSPFGRTAA